jgi:hypothetical protein
MIDPRLITHLGWRHSIIIVGGLVLTCIIFGCLMRPLESMTEASKVRQPSRELVAASNPEIFTEEHR